jgi:branched-chain amino acid transport system permease protein
MELHQLLDMLPQQIVFGLTLGSIYALLALGFTMVYGILEMINFAHGEVFMVGSFLGWGLFLEALQHKVVPILAVVLLPPMLVVAMVGCALLAMAMERLAYRPLRKAQRLAPLITAVGVSIFLQNAVLLFQLWFMQGPRTRVYETEKIFPYTSRIEVAGASMTYLAVTILAISILLMLILEWFINKTRLGRAMRATAQDSEMASIVGVSVNGTIALTFCVGGALAGAGGVLVGLYYTQIDLYMGYYAGLKAFAAAVLGGIGNVRGAMLGGYFLGVAEALSVTFLNPAYKDLIAFVILILVLLFRPGGLLGENVPEKV